MTVQIQSTMYQAHIWLKSEREHDRLFPSLADALRWIRGARERFPLIGWEVRCPDGWIFAEGSVPF